MNNLENELYGIEPKEDLLHEVLDLGRYIYSDVTKTSDGFFLGMPIGDIGYNVFLGEPSKVAKERTNKLFHKLSKESQMRVKLLLITKGIVLSEIGIEEE